MSLASSTQRTVTVNNRFRASHFVYNIGVETTVCSVDDISGLMPKLNRRHMFIFKTRRLSKGASEEGSECGNRISDANFHSNYGSILLCFRDMTMGRTTNRWMADRRRQPSQ